jgi:putative acetyltransferase
MSGRRKAIKQFTHRNPDYVFWIYPDGRLHDARDSHRDNVPPGHESIIDDEPEYGGFLRGRVASVAKDQLVVVYCREDALAVAGEKLDQLLAGLSRLPVPLRDDALVISDNGDMYGTVAGLYERAAAASAAAPIMDAIIRPETAADFDAIRGVNRLAFGQDSEARLVDALRDGGYVRASLVAERDGQVVGHILFSDLPIITDTGTIPALALAPMAVLPEFQNQGIGSALVRTGLAHCQEQGHRIVIVLGHPNFYPRFGFSAKLAESLSSPFGGGEAWMALELVPESLSGVAGRVEYPPPFSTFA